MESSEFIDRHKENWQLLNNLLEKVELGGFKTLTLEELDSLGYLYRDVSADLAFAKTHLENPKLTHYLNNLVAKAHGYIYQAKPARLKAIRQFYYCQFPLLFRRTLNFTLIALLIFLFFALAGFFTASRQENFINLLVPASILEKIEKRQMWTQDITTVAPLATSSIMTNNISVTLSAFALGITLCIGTFYILALNGLMFGVIAYLTMANNMALDFWSFALPHGVIELTCIFISGGAGLLLGSSFLLPGELKRNDALILKAKFAVKLILGCVPALILAAIIEGFISPSFLAPFLKLVFALLAGVLFLLYLFMPFSRKINTNPSSLNNTII